MATLQEIAEEAGVSIETVSRVVNGKLKEARASSRERAAKIRAIARKLNYKPNAAARAMVGQRTRQIGLFIRNTPDMPTVHLSAYETILGVDSRLSQAGYVSCLVRLNDLPADAGRSRVFGEHALDGVIVLDHLPESIVPTVRAVGKDCVWADSNVWEPAMCVRRDEFAAAQMVAEQMAELGYRKILWVVRYQSSSYLHFSFAERLEGAKAATSQRKLELESLIYRPNDLETLQQLLRHSVTPDVAVLTYDAITAEQVFHALVSLGRVAGRDYALASCDSDTRTDAYWPVLSRAAFDRHQMGAVAAEMMLARLESPDAQCTSVKLTGKWIAGETARPRNV